MGRIVATPDGWVAAAPAATPERGGRRPDGSDRPSARAIQPATAQSDGSRPPYDHAIWPHHALNQELLQVKMQLSTLTKTREEPTREESS